MSSTGSLPSPCAVVLRSPALALGLELPGCFRLLRWWRGLGSLERWPLQWQSCYRDPGSREVAWKSLLEKCTRKIQSFAFLLPWVPALLDSAPKDPRSVVFAVFWAQKALPQFSRGVLQATSLDQWSP